MTTPHSNGHVVDRSKPETSNGGDLVQTDDGEILDYRNSANGVISLHKDGVEGGDKSEMEKYCLKLLDNVWAGESALHLAIVNGDLPAVKYLVSKGADVNHRTTQTFYNEKKSNKIVDDEVDNEYRQYGYYGEYPLSFAAVFSHTDIYDFLLKSGANTDAQDSKGNTVLHMIVIHNQIEMFSYAMRHPFKRANPWTKNNEKLTPIALCCKLGFNDMFDEIMDLSRVEIWRYSNLETSLYPMASFDTIGHEGTTDKESALMILVNGDKPGHLEMLQHVVLRSVIKYKWDIFVKKRFVFRLVNFILHILMLSMCVYLRKTGLYIHQFKEPIDGGRFFFEFIFWGGSITTLMFHMHEIRADGVVIFMKHLINAPTKALLLPACCFYISSIGIRIAMWTTDPTNTKRLDHLQNLDEMLMLATILGNWPFLLFFLKSHDKFGPLIITLYTMIGKDVSKVMIIFSIFWIMYSIVFLYLFQDTGYEPLLSLDRSIMTIFHMSFGSFDYKYFELSKYPEAAEMLFVSVMLVMPILLLNMLIATMGNTFINVNNQAQKEWFHQYAKAVVTLERGNTPVDLAKYQAQYTQLMSKHTYDCRYIKGKNRGYMQDMPDDHIIPGLSVTKLNKHTRAFVKKRSLRNWKWLYGILRTLLKAKRIELGTPQGTRVTFWDLFGTDDILESDYAREKMVVDNLRKIKLTHLFKPDFERENILDVAKMALSAKAPVQPATIPEVSDDSIDEILNDDIV